MMLIKQKMYSTGSPYDHPAKLYKLTDKKTRQVIKIGDNGVKYVPIDTGTKTEMYNKQNKLIERFKGIYGNNPPENINGR